MAGEVKCAPRAWQKRGECQLFYYFPGFTSLNEVYFILIEA